MAASPRFKVYAGKEYRAACVHIEDAAVLVAALGEGATIRIGHAVKCTVWREGAETQSAAESYDHVAAVAAERWLDWHRASGRPVGQEAP